MPDVLTFALVAGAVLPFVVAVLTKTSWSSNQKRIASLAVALLATAIGVFFAYQPDSWAAVAEVLAVVVGVGQVVYAILKPTGALNWLEELGSPERAEQD